MNTPREPATDDIVKVAQEEVRQGVVDQQAVDSAAAAGWTPEGAEKISARNPFGGTVGAERLGEIRAHPWVVGIGVAGAALMLAAVAAAARTRRHISSDQSAA